MKKIHKQSSLFILELIISITFLYFQHLFVSKYLWSLMKSLIKPKTWLLPWTIVQVFLKNLKMILLFIKTKKSNFKYYNQNWEKSSKKKATYTISIYCKEENSLKKIQVKAYQQKKKIYSLNDEVYVKEDIYGN